jgi:hypothetical protein
MGSRAEMRGLADGFVYGIRNGIARAVWCPLAGRQ